MCAVRSKAGAIANSLMAAVARNTSAAFGGAVKAAPAAVGQAVGCGVQGTSSAVTHLQTRRLLSTLSAVQATLMSNCSS